MVQLTPESQRELRAMINPDAAAALEEVKAEARREGHEAGLKEAAQSEFTFGYVIACCNLQNLHGETTAAYDVLAELNVTKAEIEALDLSEYDLEALSKIERAMGENDRPYRAARAEKGGA